MRSVPRVPVHATAAHTIAREASPFTTAEEKVDMKENTGIEKETAQKEVEATGSIDLWLRAEVEKQYQYYYMKSEKMTTKRTVMKRGTRVSIFM